MNSTRCAPWGVYLGVCVARAHSSLRVPLSTNFVEAISLWDIRSNSYQKQLSHASLISYLSPTKQCILKGPLWRGASMRTRTPSTFLLFRSQTTTIHVSPQDYRYVAPQHSANNNVRSLLVSVLLLTCTHIGTEQSYPVQPVCCGSPFG